MATVSGLRMRYVPRNRLGQGLVSMAPWLDFVLLLVFFLLIRGNLILQPGVVVDLPQAPVRGGARPEMVAVVLSMETRAGGAREEVVVFEDQSYRVTSEAHMAALRAALGKVAGRRAAQTLVLEADRRVQHGTLMRLYDMAQDAGLREVNLASRPAEGGGS